MQVRREMAGERGRRAVRQLLSAGSFQVATVCPTTVRNPRTVAREAPEVTDDNFFVVFRDEPGHGIRCRRGGREEKVRLFYLPMEMGQEGGERRSYQNVGEYRWPLFTRLTEGAIAALV